MLLLALESLPLWPLVISESRARGLSSMVGLSRVSSFHSRRAGGACLPGLSCVAACSA
ncbi:MAG: hypothetical protein WCD37_04515 [Chloroflexia bacterium]